VRDGRLSGVDVTHPADRHGEGAPALVPLEREVDVVLVAHRFDDVHHRVEVVVAVPVAGEFDVLRTDGEREVSLPLDGRRRL
jgi:hypothetical protein